MTAQQEQRAVQLLRAALDWVGIVDLSAQEEVAAGEVSDLIQGLLGELQSERREQAFRHREFCTGVAHVEDEFAAMENWR